ncbi:DUF4325 domain-containing protein [Treponema phagedenis]|nr:STAS-like domain-containing protein [Treponema phagedenis]QEJ96383.1 DUF4325 domain-containing protein [Treponema phagedenis]QEK02020.1 DUF4325 domain-containing protein [Treponema phagedenis]QEK07913.1 DUF4325 domain-containing protein [Treponema phagedenis]QKS91334.1 STAS-like domain-containing protein [Treponema phagedenis]QSH95600.1 DUF4325 domain-containing protein [Treponema phagedenis]
METLKIAECGNGYQYQGPRFDDLGPDSGEEFRDEYLIPWLKNNNNASELCVDFEGTVLFTPSFLEESFGGAIRKGFEIVRKIQFKNIPPDVKQQLAKYINKAKKQ